MGDGSLGKAFAIQEDRSEFESQNLCKYLVGVVACLESLYLQIVTGAFPSKIASLGSQKGKLWVQ